MLSCLQRKSTIGISSVIRVGIVNVRPIVLFSTKSLKPGRNNIPVSALMNDETFDKLIRKPHEQQVLQFKYPSNARFAAILTKHIAIDSLLVICSSLGACAICSAMGVISTTLVSSFNDPSFLLNRLFPFLLNISGDSMRYTFQLMGLLSPGWLVGSVGLTWLGCRLELNKVYKRYEEKNDAMMEKEEKPDFVQHCSLEDGCSVRLFGDETENSGRQRFSSTSAKDAFYNGYGGDCSYKAPK